MSQPRGARKLVGNATRYTWSDDEVGNLICAVLTVREAGLIGRVLDDGENVAAGVSSALMVQEYRRQLSPQRLLGIPDVEAWWVAVRRGYSGDAKARATLKAMAHEVLTTAMAEPIAAARAHLAATKTAQAGAPR